MHPAVPRFILYPMTFTIVLLFAWVASVGAPQYSPRASIELAYGDTSGADFASWVVDAKDEIRKRWALPYSARGQVGHTAVSFTVDRSGDLAEARVELPSGIPEFDDAAVRAVKAPKFLPLPSDYPGEQFTVTLVFWFNEPSFDVFKGARKIIRTDSAPSVPPAPAPEPSPAAEEPPAAFAAEEPEEEPPARKVVVFKDGTTLQVEKYEVRGGLVILHRIDGRLQSVPRTAVDLESMEKKSRRKEN